MDGNRKKTSLENKKREIPIITLVTITFTPTLSEYVSQLISSKAHRGEKFVEHSQLEFSWDFLTGEYES